MDALSPPLDALHKDFLALLPRIEQHGRVYFRHIRCPHGKADAIQEMRALAWLWFVRLTQRGKDVNEFLTTFVSLLARAVNSGRRLAGMNKLKDAMNPITQKLQGFKVEVLPSSTGASHEHLYATVHGQREHDAFEERLRDNSMTPVPEQAAFRIDWPSWLRTRTHRDRRIIKDLIAGGRTLDVSRKFGLCPARIAQLRHEFHQDWQQFHGTARTEVV